MKLQFLLLAVLPIAFAADCACPQVKCPGDEPALCKCLNSAALACYKKCGGPSPHIQSCPKPISSTTIVTPTPTAAATCGSRGLPPCPDGNVCVNDPSKPGCDIAADCPGICVKPSTTTTATPRATAAICGSRGLPPCPYGTTCVNDPRKPGCDIRADCPGICVKLDGPFCGGIAGSKCPQSPEQVCIDDPRDDCAPPTGADCGGTCVFLDGRSSASPTS